MISILMNAPSTNRSRPGRRGMTLIEVMVAALIFSFSATALVTLFIQNSRFARAITLRTVATTAAIGISEQIRAYAYGDYEAFHNAPTTSNMLVELFDPRVTDNSAAIDTSDPEAVTMAKRATESGMRLLKLPINAADGTTVNAAWTEVSLPMSVTEDGKSMTLPINLRFWVDSQHRQPTVTVDKDGKKVVITRCQLFEIALVYQWKNPNYSNSKWHSGVIRMVTPNKAMDEPDTVVEATP